MRWEESDGVRWLEAELPGARAVFSTRSAGSLKESRAPLARAIGVDPDRIVSGQQVHGAELAVHDGPGAGTPEVDGHVLRAEGPVALVYTADCLPVALSGPGGAAVLHCGWRGLAAGIVARGAEAVAATHAAIGPGIGPCCYEVGAEVLAPFERLGPGIAAGRMLDLPEVTGQLLRRAGVGEIESAGLCTRCEPDLFFSHRRDGGPGRQGGLVWLEQGKA
ncbi:MAG TPA: polyphenol oxidase family protein [Solirubrobacterales bacterium]|nr:polyphenol oxidase family protein [Solirubrobacterales bacterium]